MGQMSHTWTTNRSRVIYGGVAGKLSCIASRPAKSLLDLEKSGVILSIDLKLGPSSSSGALRRIPPRLSVTFVDLRTEYKPLTLKLASRLNLKDSKRIE